MFRNAQTVYTPAGQKLPGEATDDPRPPDMLDYDFFEVLDQRVTVAHITKLSSATTTQAPSRALQKRLPPISDQRPKLSTLAEHGNYREIYEAGLPRARHYCMPGSYVHPSKMEVIREDGRRRNFPHAGAVARRSVRFTHDDEPAQAPGGSVKLLVLLTLQTRVLAAVGAALETIGIDYRRGLASEEPA